MKNFNKEIRRLVLEISTALLLVFISVPLWTNFQKESYAQTAYSYANNTIVDLIPMTDVLNKLEVANENNYNQLQNMEFLVKNYSKNNCNYELLLRLDNELSIEYINISVNGKLIDNNRYYDDEEYYYLLIDDNTVNGYKTFDYDIKMWLDEDIYYDNITQLNYLFMLQ